MSASPAAAQPTIPVVPGDQSVVVVPPPAEPVFTKQQMEEIFSQRFRGAKKEIEEREAALAAAQAAEAARLEFERKAELERQGKHGELLAEERKARESAEQRLKTEADARAKAEAEAAVLKAERDTQIANRKAALKTRFEALPEQYRGAIGSLLELPAAYDAVDQMLLQQEGLAGIQAQRAGAMFQGQPRPPVLAPTSGDPLQVANARMAAAFDYSKRGGR